MMLSASTPTIAGDLPSYVASGLTPPPRMRTPSGIRQPTPVPHMPGTMVLMAA
jgi:hypothetical protein